MKSLWKTFKQGIIYENPLLMLMIGLCSALAVTSSVANGLGMGLAMTFVLLFSEIVISLFRKVIPNSVRIPIFIIIIAAFTTMVDLVMKAYFPDLSKSMGVFIPLIVVNCIIMGRVEAFASKQKLMPAIFDSLGMGLGYTWVMIAISAVRELLGNGSLAGIPVMPASYQPILFFILPPGGFLVFGLFISFNIWLKGRMEKTAKERA
ncbi:MAG: electron transport complex subunit RsxE [Spirochaetia bacterium]|jgi:electron transport complex protein RnfE|uniref:Electron transport complex subunit RnfE n=1 Tax=bioreactor metagenome TaxID=1076179 RepID=A0A644TY50_9ZZZZ|nr:electron transport complex subunit RsxE [Spirochaetia bacterium]MDD3820418.1 electron transport complex subunit RsxE [Spirochaetales bacterium]NLX44716.1 electron transport complex subunit RsxE [Treponema sp.]VBB39285.1 Electron transport complex subunit E [uncultured Spirochaetota bacterium]HAP54956.1 electron transport complex subunit RsxE [Spirochaetaceae bacterium]